MDLILSWLVFPAVLAVACVGSGLAFEALIGTRIPGGLLPGCGFTVMIIAGQYLTLTDATAEFATPAIVTLAVIGFGLAVLSDRRPRPPTPLLVAAVVVFCLYAAPIVLSGAPTLAGYIRLDDTATWLAFTDRLMEHGRDLGGLSPSTYEATLAVNIGDGYPVGVFLPFGAVAQLLALDPAWVIQPYMAFAAVLFALAAWVLVAPLVRSAWQRAAIVAIAAQPALLYGYYLWGGVKELAAAAMIATVAAMAGQVVDRPNDGRVVIGLGLCAGGLVGILSAGGALWLAPILIAVAIVLARSIGLAAVARRAATFAVVVGLLALPVILPGGLLPPTSSPLSDSAAKGNLIEPLEPVQALGIWPAGDFRLDPGAPGLTYAICALALLLVLAGGWWAARQRAAGVQLLLTGALAGGLGLLAIGSPWVEGKALATASPMLLLVALIGCVAISQRLSAAGGLVAASILSLGVLWSNTLAYSDVNLAPYSQFEELETIGELIAGEGPTLMTEYSPYGARHFLRAGDPESVSELRRRTIPKRNGGTVRKGSTIDTDELQTEDLYIYRTLVLRRSPAQSRPPADYQLAWAGSYYEVWQRSAAAGAPTAHLPLGDRYDPIAAPDCGEVKALPDPSGTLIAATGVSPVVVPLSPGTYPRDWTSGLDVAPAPDGAGTIRVQATIERPDRYEVWLGESVRPLVEAFVDGEPIGSVRHELNNYGQYVSFGSVVLRPGTHTVELRFGGRDLHPGSGGRGDPVGPIVLSGTEAGDSRLVELPPAEICGREWDWIATPR